MKPKVVIVGDAKLEQNPLTGDWLVYGQKGTGAPYACDTLELAKKMAKTINHYNKTNEIKAF